MLTNDFNSLFCVTEKKVDKGVAKSRVQNNLAVTLHKLCSDNLHIHKNLQKSEFIQLIKKKLVSDRLYF